MFNRFDEEECEVFNFVKSCLWKERSENWNEIAGKEEEIAEMAVPEVLSAFLEPEKNPKLLEKYENELSKLEFLEAHRECGFDAFLYNRFLNFFRYEITRNTNSFIQFFKEKEDKFFTLPAAVPEPGLRQLKSAKNYAAKITQLLKNENQTVFFELKANAFGCYFYSIFYENVFFPLEKMNLIPSFVRWRNSNLIRWTIEAIKSKEERAFKNFEKNLLLQELDDGNRELERSFYEEYEDKIRALFEMKTEFKVMMIQQTVDLSPESIYKLQKVILVRYQDFRSVLKPEVERMISVENFEEDFEDLKKSLALDKA